MKDIIKQIKEIWNKTHYSYREREIIVELKKFLIDLEEKIKQDDTTFY